MLSSKSKVIATRLFSVSIFYVAIYWLYGLVFHAFPLGNILIIALMPIVFSLLIIAGVRIWIDAKSIQLAKNRI